MEPRTVVFILSLPRSGSTLLGHFLGSHPDVMYSGEIPSPLKKGHPVRCRYCGNDTCPVWGKMLDPPFVHRCYRTQQSFGRGVARRVTAGIRRKTDEYQPPGALFQRVFKADPDTHVIVDSSKDLSWVDWNRATQEYESRFVFLLRDLRGVVSSLRRNNDQPIRRTIRRATGSLQRLRRYVKRLPAGQVLTVRYEDLTEQPDSFGRTVCDFLHIPFDRRMKEFYRYPSHVIGGNCGPVLQCRITAGRDPDGLRPYAADSLRAFYLNRSVSILSDDRWKHELNAAALQTFETEAGACNRSLGYT